jgi:uncharacterized repeat protein (TIGR01451 family)
VTQAFSPVSVAETIAATLTITFTNANAFDLTEVSFTDTLPGALTITSSPAPATTCTFTNYSLEAASGVITLSGGDIPPKSSCTVTVSVSSSTAGTFTNTIAAGALSTGPGGSNAAASSAALTVTVPHPPTVALAFSPTSIAQNGSSTLTVTLGNSNSFALTGAALTDSLPSGLTVSSSPAATNSCGGTLASQSTSVSLSGGTIPASGSCTLVVTVSSGTAGTYSDSIAASAFSTQPAGANTTAASASLTVTASGGGGGLLTWLNLLLGVGLIAERSRREGKAQSVLARAYRSRD